MNARWSAVAYLVDSIEKPTTVELFQKLDGSNFGIGKYNGCGGKPNFRGEKPLQVVTREVLEEAGYTMHNPVLAGVLHTHWPNGTPPKEATWFRKLYIYLCDSYEQTQVPSGEMNPGETFSVLRIPEPKLLIPETLLWLPSILSGKIPDRKWEFTFHLTPARETISFSKRTRRELS